MHFLLKIKIGPCLIDIHCKKSDYRILKAIFLSETGGFIHPIDNAAVNDLDKQVNLMISLFKSNDDVPKNRELKINNNNNNTTFYWKNIIAHFNNNRTVYATIYPHDNLSNTINYLLRLCISYFIIFQGHILLHTAGIIVLDKCFLFSGPSGSGKSTICAHALKKGNDFLVLSDEMLIIENSKSINIHTTPFWGALILRGEIIEYPLNSIFFLKKSSGNKLIPLNKQQTIERLLENVILYKRTPDNIKVILSNISKISSRIKAFDLYFTEAIDFWPMII